MWGCVILKKASTSDSWNGWGARSRREKRCEPSLWGELTGAATRQPGWHGGSIGWALSTEVGREVVSFGMRVKGQAEDLSFAFWATEGYWAGGKGWNERSLGPCRMLPSKNMVGVVWAGAPTCSHTHTPTPTRCKHLHLQMNLNPPTHTHTSIALLLCHWHNWWKLVSFMSIHTLIGLGSFSLYCHCNMMLFLSWN